MKLDITKLPVVEGVVAFLIVTIGITFAAAFAATDGGGEGEAVSESPTPRETGSPGPRPSPGGPIPVAMQDNSFDPDAITVPGGSTATFEITNDGASTHNMHIVGPEGEYTEDFCTGGADPCSDPPRLGGGDSAILTWQVPSSSGEVDFRCDYHPTEMTGTITID